MSKTVNKDVVADVNAQIAALNTEIDTKALGKAVTAKKLALLEQIEFSTDSTERQAAMQPLTPELIESRIESVVIDAFDAFFQAEQRIEADNGKAYPLDWDFEGRDYSSTDNVVIVDKFAFISKQMARAICSGLEMVLRSQGQTIERQREKIVKELRFGRNTGADVAAKAQNMAQFLEAMVEQEALIRIALHKAAETYDRLTGEAYATREERDALAKARVNGIKGTALDDYLQKLGVNADAS